MKKDIIKNIIIGFLLVIILVLSVILGLVLNNKISHKEPNDISNPEQQDETKDDDFGYDESDYIRQTKVTLIEEPACNGYDSSATVVASIGEDGIISISQGRGAIKVEPGNAKYLYHVGKLACSAVSLYYITEDNELYVLEEPNNAVDQVAKKVTDDKVVEFLGIGLDANNHYIKVLLENGEVRHISYLVTLS